ncbi:MAG: winged helix-turn-helix domain-containing protein [Acidobacteriota bacterium]
MESVPNFYKFGEITVDCENFRVQKDGRNVALTPRAFDVLTLLIRNEGHVIDKQTLFDQIWKENFVSDNALTRIIKEIRHALEDSADQPKYVETVTKRGYRFIGKLEAGPSAPLGPVHDARSDQQIDDSPVPFVEPATPEIDRGRFSLPGRIAILSVVGVIIVVASGWWYLTRQSPEPNAQIHSIAVLPFKPLNADSRDESLEFGMAETLITRLSNLRQLAVRPMSSVRKYADAQSDPIEAGRSNQVEAVLDGSIQKAGDQIRVTVRLIDVASGSNLWSEKFDESFTDIFKVQDAIAERVTNALTLQLSKQEREQMGRHYTSSSEAYQLYLNAQLIWHGRRQNWVGQSLAYYQQALEKDPNFALAYVGIADANITLTGRHEITVEEGEKIARANINRALEIDNTLAQAHNALAELKYQYEYDWTGAEQEFKRAVDLNPNVAWIRVAYGWFLMSEGRFDEATFEMNRAGELDPSSMTIKTARGRLLYFSRHYDEAVRHFENLVAVEPNDDGLYLALFLALDEKGMYPEALDAFLKFRSLNGEKPERLDQLRDAFKLSGSEGFVTELHRLISERAKTGPAPIYSLARLSLRLGKTDEAFMWLDRAFTEHDIAILQTKIDPGFDSVRDDPRFIALLSRIGLQP